MRRYITFSLSGLSLSLPPSFYQATCVTLCISVAYSEATNHAFRMCPGFPPEPTLCESVVPRKSPIETLPALTCRDFSILGHNHVRARVNFDSRGDSLDDRSTNERDRPRETAVSLASVFLLADGGKMRQDWANCGPQHERQVASNEEEGEGGKGCDGG